MMQIGEENLVETFIKTVAPMAVLTFRFLLQGSFTKVLRQDVPLYVFTDN